MVGRAAPASKVRFGAARATLLPVELSRAAPNLTLDAGAARPTTVQAQKGVYHEDQRQLALSGQVQVKSGGYVFNTPNATVDTSKGAVYGKSGVEGQGPLGRVTASSYGVYDRGKRVIMKGDVHAHIVQ